MDRPNGPEMTEAEKLIFFHGGQCYFAGNVTGVTAREDLYASINAQLAACGANVRFGPPVHGETVQTDLIYLNCQAGVYMRQPDMLTRIEEPIREGKKPAISLDGAIRYLCEARDMPIPAPTTPAEGISTLWPAAKR